MALVSTADAGAKRYPRAQIVFDVPDAWSEQQDASSFIVMDAKQEALVLFQSLPARDVKTAASTLDAQLSSRFSELKWSGKATPRTLNGLKAITVDGKGKYKGFAVDLGVALVGSPTGRVVLVAAMVKSDKKADHQAALKKVLTSIKAAKIVNARRSIGDAKLSVEVPDDWKEETKKSGALVLNHPSGDAGLMLLPMDSANVTEASSKIDAKIGELFSDVKWSKKTAQKKINGMQAAVVEGTGKFNNQLENLWVAIVQPPSGKVVIAFVRVQADMAITYKPQLSKILASLKPM